MATLLQDLPANNSLNPTDLMLVNQSNTSYKTTTKDVLDIVDNLASAGSLTPTDLTLINRTNSSLKATTKDILDIVDNLSDGGTALNTDLLLINRANSSLKTTVPNISNVLNYNSPLADTVVQTMRNKFVQTISVKDFGAVGDGVTDDTAAFNLALAAAEAWSTDICRKVEVPEGVYVITDTLRVRKGQMLIGHGIASQLDLTGVPSINDAITLGLDDSGKPDPGGYPCYIDNIATLGGPSGAAAIRVQVPGAFVNRLFLTAPGIGLVINAADVCVNDVIIDQSLNGMVITESINCVLNNIILYLCNFALYIVDSSDIQFNNVHMEYTKYNPIIFPAASSFNNNIIFNNLECVTNEQFLTLDAQIKFDSSNNQITISDAAFRNYPGWGVLWSSGVNNILTLSNVEFNGLKTVASYDQSTTCAGMNIPNMTTYLNNVSFKHLNDDFILIGNSAGDQTYLYWNGGYVIDSNNVLTSSSVVNVTNALAGSEIDLRNVDFGNRLFMNANTYVEASMTGCKNPFYLRDNGTDFIINIPYWFSNIYNLGVRCNINPGGSTVYRKSLSLLIQKDNDFSGTPRSYLNQQIAIEGAAHLTGLVSSILTVEFQGGGVDIPNSNSGYIDAYLPNTVGEVTMTLDKVI